MPLDDGLYDFYEQTGGQASPVSAGFSMDGGRATGPWFTPRIEPEDLEAEMPDALWNNITTVLGTTQANGENGGLNRTLPRACPPFPWLVAERITSIVGLGPPVLLDVDPDNEYEVQALTSAYCAYPIYRFNIDFLQKPYDLLLDDSIQTESVTWTKEDESEETLDVQQEWYRYVDWDVQPSPEILDGQQGQLILRTNAETGVHGKPCNGFPRIGVPKATIRFRWYQIPFKFIGHAESNLVKYLFYINQTEWYETAPGELLYLGLTVSKRYPPPVPEYVPTYSGGVAFSTEKLCDVEMLFEWTIRTAGATPPTPENNNWIAAGHNLLPYLGGIDTDRGFYYATANSNTAAYQHPVYPSVPFQILFRDPDV